MCFEERQRVLGVIVHQNADQRSMISSSSRTRFMAFFIAVSR